MKIATAIIIGLGLTIGVSSAAFAKEKESRQKNQQQIKEKKAELTVDQKLEQVRQAVQKRYPATSLTSVSPSGIDGIYELMMGSNIAYTDENAKLLIFGHLFDMQTQRDITQDRIDEATKINFSSLPFDKAVKVVKGNGSRTFAVFTDPDCPYCRQLEEGMSKLDNYTMYVFMYPIPQLHPAAEDHANSVWCSQDRAVTWNKSVTTGKFPEDKNCQTPTREIMALGERLGVQGTPTIFRADGRRQGGAMPPEALSKWLDQK